MRPIHALLLTVCLWAGIYLPGLGDAELKGEEGRRILPAREMLRRGDFVLPYSEGRPYHRKPPGINWAIAASFAATGKQTEWTARLPSVLAVLALALAGLWAGRKLLDTGAGLALALVCLTNLGMMEKGRLAEIEALYVSLAGIGMFLWAAHWVREESPWLVWLSTAIPFALANLVKGPVFLAFFYPVAGAVLWRGRRLRELRHPAHIISLALSLLPMIFWGILVKRRMAGLTSILVLDDEGQPQIAKAPEEVWWQQIAGRLNFTDINWGDWLALPLRSILLFAPWLLLAVVLWSISRKRPEMTQTLRFQALFRGLGLGSFLSAAVFCLLPSTRSRYLFPLLTPVALWTVIAVRQYLAEAGQEGRIWRVWRWIVALGGLIVAAAGLALPFIWISNGPWLTFLANIAVIAGLLIWLGLAWRNRLPERLFTSLAGVLTAGAIIAATTVIPWARRWDNVRSTADSINALTPLPGNIVAINPGPQPFLFYLGVRCVEVTRITEFPADVDYLLISPEDWADEEWHGRMAWRNFTHVIGKFTDRREPNGREYLLIGRPPESKSTRDSPAEVK